MAKTHEDYQDVPWYRRNGIVSVLVLAGLFLPPLLWIVCIICLTGHVYYNPETRTYFDSSASSGGLPCWSFGNKIVAVILVLGQLYLLAMALGVLHHQMVNDLVDILSGS